MAYNEGNDKYPFFKGSPINPARYIVEVVPNDTEDLDTYAKELYIGGAGTITLLAVGNYKDGATTGTLLNVVAGQKLDIQTARVFATGTTATGIVAAYDK